jgi:hypothetical protein
MDYILALDKPNLIVTVKTKTTMAYAIFNTPYDPMYA